ncbi:gluconate 2-dehydrogenase subunit 3 family protein [Aureimonas altamirensis]|uniref:gluconate 2-dehydrogenase subunit 3 family protein n=1 Tax=Aureimonas altamirensis TaxID=370622 RepID=UPI001E4C960E|nr:gluconate 2-dehydrogenase subunit 3 family protein [Aureimonas altamirensis]UHD44538.1 gluconate 2-dehydrogenase subunit 3 family protein [Aureimonas altamirensis]
MSGPLSDDLRGPTGKARTAYHDETRVSPRLAAILADRARPDVADDAPKCLTGPQYSTLRAVLAQVVPHDIPGLDLAKRIDMNLHSRAGNGWRTERLPDDAEAYALALDTLDAASLRDAASRFADLPTAEQQRMLTTIAEGTFVRPAATGLDSGQMSDWFEDLRSDAVRLYVAHPQAIASIGYEGQANGAHGGAAFEGWTDAEIEGTR